MAASWLETAIEILGLATQFVVALFLPLVLQLLFLFLVGLALFRLVDLVSWRVGSLLLLVGAPIHEFSHALGCWLTLGRVSIIKPLSGDPGAAYVRASPNFGAVGRMVVSVAPLFGCTIALWLSARYIIPGFEIPTVAPPQLDLESAGSASTILQASIDYLWRLFQSAYQHLPSLDWSNWRTYVGLYLALSVGISIALSPTDLRILLSAIPVAILLILGLFVLIYASGNIEATFLTLQKGLFPSLLLKFSTAATYALVLAALGILVFLPMRFIQWLLEDKSQKKR